jgi:hypothetical protein
MRLLINNFIKMTFLTRIQRKIDFHFIDFTHLILLNEPNHVYLENG